MVGINDFASVPGVKLHCYGPYVTELLMIPSMFSLSKIADRTGSAPSLYVSKFLFIGKYVLVLL